MAKRAWKGLVRLAREDRGVALLETALIAPIILMLLAGAVDFAMGFSLKLQTQQAAARTIEFATSAGLQTLSDADLQADAASAAGVPTSQVTVDRWLECAGVRQTDFDAGCDTGEQARYVSVRIDNSYQPMWRSLLPASIAQGGAISFSGFSTVRLQ